MPLQQNGTAPYTTAAAAITAIEAFRERGMGTPISAETLTRAGVPESISNRTLSSLKLLELVEESGAPSTQFQALKQARGDEEYRTRLQEWLRGVYAEVLQYTDPSTDSPERVAEAFRTYEPAGQRKAMAALLIGLWKLAGLPTPEGTPTPRRSQPSVRRATAHVRRTRQRHEQPPPVTPPTSENAGALFGITVSDIAALSEEEFQVVWGALGKVARARARAKQEPAEDSDPVTTEPSANSEGGDG